MFQLFARIPGLMVFATTLLLLSSVAHAETLRVVVAQSVDTNFPEIRARIVRALSSTGYEIELLVLPGNRALLMASRGEVAIDIYRQPSAIASVPNLIALEPQVDEISFGMIVSKLDPDKCHVDREQFGEMTVVGRLGIMLYEDFYYPMFASSVTVNDFPQLLKVVAKQRVDVSFLTRQALDRAPPEIRDQLILCNTHMKKFPIKSFIHKDYLWAREKIEDAYRSEFGG